jgi:hypothetical protein
LGRYLSSWMKPIARNQPSFLAHPGLSDVAGPYCPWCLSTLFVASSAVYPRHLRSVARDEVCLGRCRYRRHNPRMGCWSCATRFHRRPVGRFVVRSVPVHAFHNRLVLTDGLVATCGAGRSFLDSGIALWT